MALDFFAGCLGGCAGIVVGYPLDTVKVHMQTQDFQNPQYRGTWHCFRTILAKESLTGLYRGMSSPMAGVAAVNAIVFGVYGLTQKMMGSDELSAHFLAGAFAGLAQAPVCSPLELAKTRLQLQSLKKQQTFSGPLQCLRHIYKHNGCRGIYKGLGITCLREGPSFGVYFITYEALAGSRHLNEPVNTGRMLFAGGFAGIASWMVSYPLDVLKSRVQGEATNRYAGAWDCLKQSMKEEGFTWLYKGLNTTIIRAFPTNAATFAVVNWTLRLLGEEREKTESPCAERQRRRRLDEYEPTFNNWNILLQTVSNDRMIHRSYYPTISTYVSSALQEMNYCTSYASVSRDTIVKKQFGRKECEVQETNQTEQLDNSEEIENNREETIQWSFVEETFAECGIDSKSSLNPSTMNF